MSEVQAVWIGLVAVLAYIAGKAVSVAIEREYDSWAPALAVLIVKLAGFISRTRRDQWEADVLYDQGEKGRTALGEAIWHLIGAPGLALREAPARIRSRGSRAMTQRNHVVTVSEGGRVINSGNVVVVPASGSLSLQASGAVHSSGNADLSGPYSGLMGRATAHGTVRGDLSVQSPRPGLNRRGVVRSRIIQPPRGV